MRRHSLQIQTKSCGKLLSHSRQGEMKLLVCSNIYISPVYINKTVSLLSTSIRPIPSFTIMTWLNQRQRRVFVPSARNLVLFQGGTICWTNTGFLIFTILSFGKNHRLTSARRKLGGNMWRLPSRVLLQLHHSHQGMSPIWLFNPTTSTPRKVCQQTCLNAVIASYLCHRCFGGKVGVVRPVEDEEKTLGFFGLKEKTFQSPHYNCMYFGLLMVQKSGNQLPGLYENMSCPRPVTVVKVRARILVFFFGGGGFRIKQKTRANEATTNTQRLFLDNSCHLY